MRNNSKSLALSRGQSKQTMHNTKKCCYPAYEFSASKGNGLESLGKPSGNVFFLLNGTHTRCVKMVRRVSGIVASLSETDLLLRPRSLSLEECFSDEYRTLFKNKFELICTCFLQLILREYKHAKLVNIENYVRMWFAQNTSEYKLCLLLETHILHILNILIQLNLLYFYNNIKRQPKYSQLHFKLLISHGIDQAYILYFKHTELFPTCNLHFFNSNILSNNETVLSKKLTFASSSQCIL